MSTGTDIRREELLVVRCQLGERDAFEELIRTWSGPLLSHLRRVAGTAVAEDLAQDVWIKVLRGIAGLREGARLKPWLLRIAHNVLMDHLRLRYAQSEVPVAADDIAAGDVAADGPNVREEMLSFLESRLAALPLPEREVLTLFYLEDLTLAEIAKILAIPEGTVKSRLFRARRQLRASMSAQGETP